MTKSQRSKKCIWLGAGTPNKLETHLWTEHIPAPGFSKSKLRKTFLCVHRHVTSQQLICSLLWKAASSSSYQISNVIDLREKKKKDNLQHYLWKFANFFCSKCFQHLPLLILATDTRLRMNTRSLALVALLKSFVLQEFHIHPPSGTFAFASQCAR